MSGPSDPRVGARWTLVAHAPAKINLGLAVVGRRPDGYHELRTVFQAIDLCDTLHARERAEPGVHLEVAGPEAVPAGPENLVSRMAALLLERWAPGRGAEIRLEKHIPVGAGLGGGSSDAAAALLVLERLWGLVLAPDEKLRLALAVGSDVPFFLCGGTARGEGRGERLTPLPPPPPAEWTLVVPEYRLSTARVFARVSADLTFSIERLKMLEIGLLQSDFDLFVDNIVNDLERGAVQVEPRLALLKEEVIAAGARGVGLTGSGSAFFALTRDQGDARRLRDEVTARTRAQIVPFVPVSAGVRVAEA